MEKNKDAVLAKDKMSKIELNGKEFSGMYIDDDNRKAFTVQECNCCQTCKA